MQLMPIPEVELLKGDFVVKSLTTKTLKVLHKVAQRM